MAQPYIGEIRIFPGTYAPDGWSFCDGSIIAISENDTLFNLIGTTYGGDGQSTFALPDMRGRLPIHQGNGFVLAQSAGVEQVTITTQQIPSHSHAFFAKNNPADSAAPQGNMLGVSSNTNVFFNDTTNVTMNPAMLTATGGNQPHENMQPYLCVQFIISLYGIYPSPS
ncbi:MAG: tail fiber protein [Arcicella sp.]|nr:tail fiber protein [Arcicella sp.]